MDAKPVPTPNAETRAYWQACNEGRLLIQHCQACGQLQFYPRLVCTRCASASLDWIEASGRASVKSFTIIRRAVSPAFEADVPYVVALVTLEEGPTMMANIVDCDPERVTIGQSVQVLFERRSETMVVPQFRPG